MMKCFFDDSISFSRIKLNVFIKFTFNSIQYWKAINNIFEVPEIFFFLGGGNFYVWKWILKIFFYIQILFLSCNFLHFRNSKSKALQCVNSLDTLWLHLWKYASLKTCRNGNKTNDVYEISISYMNKNNSNQENYKCTADEGTETLLTRYKARSTLQ